MPKILSYTPPWLARPSAGSKVFTDPPTTTSPSSPSKRPSQLGLYGDKATVSYQGPRKLLANRGTEIFTAVGNKIRWTDLSRLKEDWEEQTATGGLQRSIEPEEKADVTFAPYRELTVAVYQPIRQLIISPSEIFLAILTEHTVHVAVLPDVSYLADQDRSPLKLKTYQLGRTTHVIPQSPVVTALWHPLANSSYSTDCLITITAEAAVRVWELDRANQWSFDRPGLAVDLKKLVDGTSCDQDFAPSNFGKNKGFSADVFDMEATSASFGGSGLAEEDGWAAMTLWIAMRNGDIYALCPLLPSRWRPSPTTVPALSTSVVSKMASIGTGDLEPDEEGALRQQYQWVQEIDDAPTVTEPDHETSSYEEILLRPSNPSAIPSLQGPFDIDLGDVVEDLEVSDIHVMAAKLDFDELLSGDEVEFADIAEAAEDSLAATIICLATTEGVMHVLLDTEGVSGQWLPRTGSGTFAVPSSDSKELLLVDSPEFGRSEGSNAALEWPVISGSVNSRYDLYITSSRHVTFMSFGDWAARLDSEISSLPAENAGLALRLKNVLEGPFALQEQVLTINDGETRDASVPLSSPVLIQDPQLGHILLTCSATHPYAVLFDQAEIRSPSLAPMRSPTMALTPIPQNVELVRASTPSAADAATARQSYEPDPLFYRHASAPLKDLLTMHIPQRQKMTLKQEIRLSPATLDIVGYAHRTLASQTSQLETAAADLFRRCERLREELSNQVKQISELSSRIQRLDGDEDDSDGVDRDYDKRLERARDRQQALSERHEALRRKLMRLGTTGRDLSANESSWIQEINELAKNVGIEHENDDEEHHEDSGLVEERFDTVKQLAKQLLEQAKSVQGDQRDTNGATKTNGHVRSSSTASKRLLVANSNTLVSSKLQKAKIAEAMTMVERESAVIEAVMARLESLNVDH